jgi:hypothetical protein
MLLNISSWERVSFWNSKILLISCSCFWNILGEFWQFFMLGLKVDKKKSAFSSVEIDIESWVRCLYRSLLDLLAFESFFRESSKLFRNDDSLIILNFFSLYFLKAFCIFWQLETTISNGFLSDFYEKPHFNSAFLSLKVGFGYLCNCAYPFELPKKPHGFVSCLGIFNFSNIYQE